MSSSPGLDPARPADRALAVADRHGLDAATLGRFVVSDGVDLLLVLEPDATIVAANVACGRTLGVTPDDLLGRSVFDLLHEHDRPLLPEDVRRWPGFRTSIGHPWEVRLRLADGLHQLASGVATDLTDRPEIRGILVVLRPVDEPGRILVSRPLLLAAVEAANSSIVIGDARMEDFPLTYANQGFRELTGYEEQEILGRNCRFLQTLEDRRDDGTLSPTDDNHDQAEALRQINEALVERRYVNVTLRNYRKDGRLFYNDLFMTPVYAGETYVGFIGVQNDITDRVIAEKTLRQRERLLSGFLDAAPALMGVLGVGEVEGSDGAGTVEPMRRSAGERERHPGRDLRALELLEGTGDEPPDYGQLARFARHLTMNAAAAEFFGVDAEDADGRRLGDLGLGGDVMRQWGRALAAAWRERDARQIQRFECDVPTPDGGPSRRLRVSLTYIHNGESARRKFCYLADDLSRLGAAERDRDLLRAAADNTDEPLLVVSTGTEPVIEYANPGFSTLFAVPDEAARGMPLSRLFGRRSTPGVVERFGGETAFRAETLAYGEGGIERLIALTASPIYDGTGRVARWAVAMRDNTERRSLERQVLQVQERERERIARDLHDTVAQQLNTLTLYVGTVRRQLAGTGVGDDQLEALDEAVEQARGAAQQARNLSHTLGNVDLRESGLCDALRRLAVRTATAYGVRIDCDVAADDDALSPGVAIQVFRIAVEAVGNAVRHGRPGRVSVTLTGDDVRRTLTVADDGVGIPELPTHAGIGLDSMRYRAGFIGAELSIRPGDGPDGRRGTIVRLAFSATTSLPHVTD